MHRHGLTLLGLGIAAIAAGCNTIGPQPKITEAALVPAQLRPNDTGIITIKTKDKDAIIRRIEGQLREDPRLRFPMKDDGQAPDEKAGDGIWSLQVDVPFNAPPGEYLINFTAYRKEGDPVTVRDKSGGVGPLAVTVPFAVVSGTPPAPATPPEAPQDNAPTN